jgi:hypothetical protein
VATDRGRVSSAETFGDTIPAPPSAARVVVVPSGGSLLGVQADAAIDFVDRELERGRREEFEPVAA